MVGRPHRDRNRAPRNGAYLAVAAAVMTVGTFALWGAQMRKAAIRRAPADSAPGHTHHRWRDDGMAVAGRSVTIHRPRSALYAFWRDFSNLPTFMEDVVAVTVNGDVSTWTIRAPGDSTVQVKTRIITDETDAQIAWRSIEGSEIETEGKVTFRDAPGDRGTEVEALIAYRPPAGAVGRLVAKLFQTEPAIQSRRELKRFKMLMETGEIATNRNRHADHPADRGGH